MKKSEAIKRILLEHKEAVMKFGQFNSMHEGYAVILEELDELWDAIKTNSSHEGLEEEAVQIGAMALRFLIDCCPNKSLHLTPKSGRK